nr:T9SS type B sorting domain-containing protein [Paludibacteraceae bacterium]
SSITLKATEKTGATYKWFANNVEILNETGSTLTVSPPSTTTYHAKVTTAGSSNTASLIPNGGFESGNILGETNDLGQHIKYEYNNMQGIDKAIGINESAIVKNAKIGNPTWFVDLEPKTGDRMLVCDGGDNPNTRIWSARDLALVGGKTYEFSCYVANIHKNSLNPAGLQFIIETPAGTQTLLSFTAPTSNGKWEFHKITYTPPVDASWAHIWINNNETAPDGNDFAIDDIYFGLEQTTGPVTTTDTFTVNVDTPATVLIEDMDVCQNAGFTLSANVSGGTNNVISWTKNGNTLSETTNEVSDTAPATVGESDTYAISVKSGVCTAVTQSATVTALSCNSTQKDTICLGNNIVLNQANTKTYSDISWTLTTGLTDTDTSTPTFTPTTAGTFAFTMTGTNTATSLIETINVTVVVEQATVSVDDVSECINNPITLTATVIGGTNNSIAWTKNGNPLSATTNEVSDTAPAAINGIDTYRITVTPTGVCPAVSSEATVTGVSCSSTQDATMCLGDSIVLNEGNIASYSDISWTTLTTGLSSTNILRPTFTPPTAGSFAFTMTGTNTATSLKETINVTVKVETPATVSVDGLSECINNPITLTAKVSGGTNNSIAWTKNGNTLSETTNEVSDTAPATINGTDTYRITVTPTGVCPAVSSEATVTGTSCGVQPIIKEQDREVCPGELHQLDAHLSATAHAWSTGESAQSVQVSSTTDTQYVVVSGPSIPTNVIDFLANNVSPVNGSEIAQLLGYQTEQYYINIFNVTIKDCGVTTILNRIVCAGETVTVGPQTFSTSGQHIYKFVGGSYLGGDSTVILNLRVIDVGIQAPKTAICMGESLSLGATANPNTEWSATWTTQPSTGLSLSNASAKTTDASGTLSGNYIVTLTASITQSAGVFAVTPHTCTATQNIVVHPNPVITDIFTTGRAATILYDQQSGTAPFTFNIGNTVYQHNELFDLPIGEYRVEIQNAEGCKSFRMFTIVPTPIIPDKFFSPNNDGVNDRWNVVGIEFYPNADIQIFDRFGKQLIRYKGSDLGWDGNYLGNPMPTTDYWYIIYVAEINETLSGHFTLKR